VTKSRIAISRMIRTVMISGVMKILYIYLFSRRIQ
jgi:hypothetical protein